jgi:hypothetical protein
MNGIYFKAVPGGRSVYKAYVCGRSVAGITGSYPAQGMDVCLWCLYFVLSFVGRGLCDGLIARTDESYRVSCMCDHRNPEKGTCVPSWERKESVYISRKIYLQLAG